MMKSSLFALALLIPLAANAQVRQAGTVTPGHITCWTTTNVLQDCGTPSSPFATSLGMINGNQVGSSINSLKGGNYNQFYTGVTPDGVGHIGIKKFGSAPGSSLQFEVDGAVVTIGRVISGGGFLLAVDYGVKADGVTSDDTAMSNAVNACAVAGAGLILPPGKILLTGAATINLHDCHLIGQGVLVGSVNGSSSYGSTFLLTSTTTKPFNIGSSWGISGVQFYWPNQTTGTTAYPPLFSPSTETAITSGWYIDHSTLVNCYDCIVTGGGRFEVSDSYIYAMRDAFRVANIGDSFRLNAIHFTPAPWYTLTNNAASAVIGNATAANTMIHAQAGGNNAINFAAHNIGAFAWRYGLKIDNGPTVAISEFQVTLDGVGTVIDSSSGGVFAAFANTPLVGSVGCYIVANGGVTSGNPTCFNLGATSSLHLGALTAGTRGDFVSCPGCNVFMNGVEANIGQAQDGGDYYFVHETANPGGATVSVQDSRLVGQLSDTHSHGIKTDVAVDVMVVQNSSFQFFNDDLNVQSAPRTIITGNWSGSTTGSESIVHASLASGGNGVTYANNQWDKPPVAVASACGTGCTVGGGAFSGFIGIGSTNPTTSATLTLPWSPYGVGGGNCAFTNSSGAVFASVSGTPPSWVISTVGAVDMHGTQIFFNCPGQQ